jgi:energy-coupling factor transporter transmembrane protein EcfT
MILEKYLQAALDRRSNRLLLGTIGYLSILVWSLAIIMFSPADRIPLSAGLCLLVAGILYPRAIQRLLRLRWLVLFGILVLVNALWIGQIDLKIWGIPLSSSGFLDGLRMALRAMVILIVVDGFSLSVGISEVAGLLEGLGLSGLGFSLGVAVNLLPNLRQSSANAWRSLWMRGGFRSQRLRALRLYLVTVIANAIRRGEDIALAAEARAYSPDHNRPLPLKSGRLDRIVYICAALSGLSILLIR